jgi:putative sterol carrier protein
LAAFLSEEWLALGVAAGRSLPEVPGASLRLQQVVTGAPGGDVRYVTVIENGRTVEQRLGDEPDADLVITTTYADALAMHRGEIDLNTGFMQGRVKIGGDIAKVFALLPLAGRTEWAAAQAEISAETRLE